jgi:hypothetical protein
MSYGDEIAEDACPICEQPRCSLSGLRDRLAPVKVIAARVLGRTGLWSGGTILLAIAAGWISP